MPARNAACRPTPRRAARRRVDRRAVGLEGAGRCRRRLAVSRGAGHDHRLPGRVPHLGQPLRGVVDAQLHRQRRRTAHRRRAGRSSRRSPSADRTASRRRCRAARHRLRGARPAVHRAPGSAAPCRAPSRPGGLPMPTWTTSGCTRGSQTACVLDAQVEPRRRAAAQGVARDGELDGLVGSARPLHGAATSLATAKRCQPLRRVSVLLQVLGLGDHHVDPPTSQALTASGAGSLDGKTERAAASWPMRASTPASALSNCAVVSIGACTGRRRARPCRCQLLAGAMGELVQLQCRARRVSREDLGRPRERRLGVERRDPRCTTGWRSAPARGRRAGRGGAPAAPPPRRTPASDRRSRSVSAGQVSASTWLMLAAWRFSTSCLEPVDLFPGQPQHRAISVPAP